MKSNKAKCFQKHLRNRNLVTFEFKEDGKLVLSHEDEDETFSFDWSLEGDKLIIEGEVEEPKRKDGFNCSKCLSR